MPFRHTFPIADGRTVVNNGVGSIPYPVITADGQYPSSTGLTWQGGTGTFEVFGTFGAGTYKLQMRGVDGVTWIDMGTALSFTVPGVAGFVAPPDRQLRLNVAGSTGAGVYAAISAIPS